MYFLTRDLKIALGIDLSIAQLTSWLAREMDLRRASRGDPEAMAVEGGRLIRVRAIRSVMPGPVGRMANI